MVAARGEKPLLACLLAGSRAESNDVDDEVAFIGCDGSKPSHCGGSRAIQCNAIAIDLAGWLGFHGSALGLV